MKGSVLMATYNGEKFLRTQIDSLLNQSYKDFEIYKGVSHRVPVFVFLA